MRFPDANLDALTEKIAEATGEPIVGVLLNEQEARQISRQQTAETITTELRRELTAQAKERYGKLPAPAWEALEGWIASVRIENLTEYLEAGGGWEAISPDEQHTITKELERAYAGKAAFITAFAHKAQLSEETPAHKRVDVEIISSLVRLAGDKNTITPEDLALEMPEMKVNPVEYFAALRFSFRCRAWWALMETGEVEDRLRWLRLVSARYLDTNAGEIHAKEARKANAKPLSRLRKVRVGKRDFVRLHKLGAGISWTFGGPKVTLESVKVDGRQYSPAPDLAIVPAGYSLLPADHYTRPHQSVLPLDETGGMTAPPLPVAVASATQYAIELPAAKLALYVMAAAMSKGNPASKTSIRELAACVYPNADLRRSHYVTLCKALNQLDALRLVLPNGQSYRVFDTAYHWRELTPAEYDQPLIVGFARSFEATLNEIAEVAGRSYRGDFLLDLTGAMALRTAGPLRQLVRINAYWNAYWRGNSGEPDPSRMPAVEMKLWAAMTNYLTPAGAEYLRTKNRAGGGRNRVSEAVGEILEHIQELEGERLIVIDKANKEQVRLLPPPEYLEAWRKARAGDDRKPAQ